MTNSNFGIGASPFDLGKVDLTLCSSRDDAVLIRAAVLCSKDVYSSKPIQSPKSEALRLTRIYEVPASIMGTVKRCIIYVARLDSQRERPVIVVSVCGTQITTDWIVNLNQGARDASGMIVRFYLI
jgi:hypothetical protein